MRFRAFDFAPRKHSACIHNLATDTPPQQAETIDLTVPQVRVNATARMPTYCGTLYIEVFARAGKIWGLGY